MGVKAKMKRLLVSRQCKDYASGVNQEPLPMPSCTSPAAFNVLPWPVVTPKNRVGGSAVFSFVFTFQFIGEIVDTPAENGGYGYDFASGVHKYLYAGDDPVNNEDPSGHDWDDFFNDQFSIKFALSAQWGSQGAFLAVDQTGACGPDVTMPVLNTLSDAGNTFGMASEETKANAALAAVSHPAEMFQGGWDIYPLFGLGHGPNFANLKDFGGSASFGTGLGADTVQFGTPARVYDAGAVNYVLWGFMNGMFYNYFRNPLSGAHDPAYFETTVEQEAAGAKDVNWMIGEGTPWDYKATEAKAFTRFGWDYAVNGSMSYPTSTALQIPTNPNNVASPAGGRFSWTWLELH
jgi:hypothetical protein